MQAEIKYFISLFALTSTLTTAEETIAEVNYFDDFSKYLDSNQRKPPSNDPMSDHLNSIDHVSFIYYSGRNDGGGQIFRKIFQNTGTQISKSRRSTTDVNWKK